MPDFTNLNLRIYNNYSIKAPQISYYIRETEMGGAFMSYDYPELYYRVYPKIISVINEQLDENYTMEQITDKQMEEMVDDIYIKMVRECPEVHEDSYERRYRPNKIKVGQRIFYGRSRIIRDLISIFLISEILRRN